MIQKRNQAFILRMVFSSLIRRRSRLLVALTGIAIGATILLGLVSLCYDIPRQLSREFRSYGANMVLMGVGGARLSREDLASAIALIPPEALVGFTPFRYESVRNHSLPYTVVGTDFTTVLKTSPYWSVSGKYPELSGEILIGTDVAEQTGLTPGRPFPLDGRTENYERYDYEFTVVGSLETGGMEDGFIFISLSDLEKMTGTSGVVDLVEVSLTTGSTEALATLAQRMKNQIPGLEAKLVTQVARSEETVLNKLKALVYLVTLVVLSLTMICVATTMMTVVLERRREIGLKKALGAQNLQVVREFLAEGLVLGILGGVGGSILGFFFARMVSESVFGRALTPELWLIPVTIAFSAIVTIVACLAPVRAAVDVEPALVLRGE
ncbi:MAG: ABC transporter permease [Deltaproteobacteria bacterium]|jgi:putative ABC transport system permease protein|nr:ABC transporter permease [Deltaproteobacteria bacterium]